MPSLCLLVSTHLAERSTSGFHEWPNGEGPLDGLLAGNRQLQERGVYIELGVRTVALTLHCFGYDRALTKEVSRIRFIRPLAIYVIYGKLVNLNAPRFIFL